MTTLSMGLSARQLVIGILMLLTTLMTVVITPTEKVADKQAGFSLEAMIPAAFGDWQIDRSIIPVQVNPQLQSVVNQLYSQTLSRTYVNAKGNRVMLSVAYGGNQSNNLQLHYPEVCYAAQGFQVSKIAVENLDTSYGALPIKRLVAEQGPRNEPITYWITIGDKVVKGGFEQKLQRVRYGLTGRVPDGMLIRVSSIDPDETAAYAVQDGFIRDMLKVLDNKDREKLIGSIGV